MDERAFLSERKYASKIWQGAEERRLAYHDDYNKKKKNARNLGIATIILGILTGLGGLAKLSEFIEFAGNSTAGAFSILAAVAAILTSAAVAITQAYKWDEKASILWNTIYMIEQKQIEIVHHVRKISVQGDEQNDPMHLIKLEGDVRKLFNIEFDNLENYTEEVRKNFEKSQLGEFEFVPQNEEVMAMPNGADVGEEADIRPAVRG